MKFRIPLIATLALILSATALAENSSTSVRQELLVTYHRMDQALAQNSGGQVLAVLEDVMATGPLRDQMIANTKARIIAVGDKDPNIVHMIQVKTSILQLAVSGNEALATVRQNVDSISKDSTGQYGPIGMTHRMSGYQILMDKWVQKGDSWYMLSETGQKQVEYVDGKLLATPPQ